MVLPPCDITRHRFAIGHTTTYHLCSKSEGMSTSHSDSMSWFLYGTLLFCFFGDFFEAPSPSTSSNAKTECQ